MNPIKMVSICTVLFSLAMISMGSELERTAIASIKKSYAAVQGSPATLTQVSGPEAKEKEGIIRNNFLMFLVAGAAFAGGVTCVCLRMAYAALRQKAIPRAILGAYFTVSFMTSFFCSPTIMKRWFTFSEEDCLSYPFLVAMGAWAAWEVVAIISERIKAAAVSRGILGVKDEVLGNTRDVTGVPSKPMPAPAVPGAKEEKL